MSAEGDDVDSDSLSRPSSLDGSDRDYAPRYNFRHLQAHELRARAAKEDAIVSIPSKIRPPTALKGGEGLRAHTSKLNSAAHMHLQNLHLAIGAHYVRFLPKYDEIRYDETTVGSDYISIMVQMGTYNAVRKSKNKALELEQKLDLWAYHSVPQEATLEGLEPVFTIELVAYNGNKQHVPDLPGLKTEDAWAVKKQLITFFTPFTHIHHETELGCLVRYCLLLAAAQNLYYIDGIAVPREPGFTGVLVELCKRKWEDERFKNFERTGVLPAESDVWDGAVKLDVQREGM